MPRGEIQLCGVMNSLTQPALGLVRLLRSLAPCLLALALAFLIGRGALRGAEPPLVSPGEGGANPEVIACLPKPFSKSKRLARIKESGGVPEIEDAVTKALQYLNRTQQPDGSWPGGSAMTGLAVLAYLGQGEAVLSPEFGDSCLKGIVALIDLATKHDGHFFPSQAMINRAGGQWDRYRALTLTQLLENQNPDGSWKVPGGGTKVRTLAPEVIANAHQRTCLCALMLEVYFQFLATIPKIRIERGG